MFDLLLLLLLHANRSQACEAAHLKFEGTSFERPEIQIDKQRIYFFRGEKTQVEVMHAAKGEQWCYLSPRKAPQKPVSGCIGAKPKRTLILRDSSRRAVAKLKVLGDSLYASLLEVDGKASGKRIQFTQVKEEGERVLEVHGWNCPNPKFLSCLGAELKTLPNYVPVNEVTVREPVDLANSLGHYRASCSGVSEANVK